MKGLAVYFRFGWSGSLWLAYAASKVLIAIAWNHDIMVMFAEGLFKYFAMAIFAEGLFEYFAIE